ncbi:MAG: protoporphyrinogen/coproporphyrinogen oxidase [Opitutales bacterium]
MGEPDEILIVGGGLAGLRCAALLEAAGARYRLFEASDGWGGRVRTDRQADGFLLDRGFQVFLTAYPEARPLFDYGALRLGGFLPGARVRAGGRFHRVSDPWRDPNNLGATLRADVGTLADKMRIGLFRHGVCRGTADTPWRGADRSALGELRARGFSETMIERFFRPFFGGIFLDPELATSARMMCFVFRMFSQGEATLPAEGIGSLSDQLAGRLDPDRIHLHRPVVRVRPDGIVLADGRELSGSAVVLAVDPRSAARLRGLTEPPMRGTAVVYFAAERSPLDEPVLVLNGEGAGPVNTLAVLTDVQPGYSPDHRSLIAVSVIRHAGTLDSPAGLRAVRDQLTRWFGHDPVSGWRHLATCSVPEALPVQEPGHLVPGELPVVTEEGLYVCGDYRESGSLNGALASGRRAGEAVLARLSGEGRL